MSAKQLDDRVLRYRRARGVEGRVRGEDRLCERRDGVARDISVGRPVRERVTASVTTGTS